MHLFKVLRQAKQESPIICAHHRQGPAVCGILRSSNAKSVGKLYHMATCLNIWLPRDAEVCGLGVMLPAASPPSVSLLPTPTCAISLLSQSRCGCTFVLSRFVTPGSLWSFRHCCTLASLHFHPPLGLEKKKKDVLNLFNPSPYRTWREPKFSWSALHGWVLLRLLPSLCCGAAVCKLGRNPARQPARVGFVAKGLGIKEWPVIM